MVSFRSGGVLRVDKPRGPTSHDVVARARKALGTRKIGHTGTLDPFAGGLLLLCVDAATRLAEYLSGLDKTYEAVMRLGERTDTLDPEGEVVERGDAWTALGSDDVEAVLQSFLGPIDQVPPQYSAKKVEGETMYRRARRGEHLVLEPVRVEVRELTLLEFSPPLVRFRVGCSSGTYVRALARDLASDLGTCGYLTELRRTRVGRFDVVDALTLEALEGMADRDSSEVPGWLSPLEALGPMERVEITADDAVRVGHGQSLADCGSEGAGSSPIALHLEGRLVAVARRDGGRLRPQKVFVDV